MVPWIWFWAPQWHFPFGGNVAQRIEPDTNWFFAGIRPEAGNSEIEKEIFDEASYGRQLGLITEVLLSLASKDTISAKQADDALADLKDVYRQVEEVKSRHNDKLARAATAVLEKLRESDPEELARIVAQFSRPAPLLTHAAPAR